MANNLTAAQYETILSINHPTKVFSVMLGDFDAFRQKSFIADDHRGHRVSPNSFYSIAEALISSLSANRDSLFKVISLPQKAKNSRDAKPPRYAQKALQVFAFSRFCVSFFFSSGLSCSCFCYSVF